MKRHWPLVMLILMIWCWASITYFPKALDAATNNGFVTLPTTPALNTAPVITATSPLTITWTPTVTSIATSCGISGGTITTTGTISRVPTVDTVSTTPYAFQNSDCGHQKLFTNAGAVALTIAQAGSGGLFLTGWFVDYICTGAAGCTLTPTTSTVNGAATLALTTNQSVRLFSDGANYFADVGKSAPAVSQLHSVGFVIDGGGVAIVTGDIKVYPTADFSCTINRIDISADQSGSITVDVWKAAGAIPTSGNKISASAPLTLSSAQLAQNGSLSGWSTSVSVGDVFGFSVATVATVTRVTGQIWCQ